MLKKIVTTLMAVLLLTLVSAEAADQTVNLIVNGKQLFVEPGPFFNDGRVFVPVRYIAEELGAQVEWDPESSTVMIARNQGDRYLKGQGRGASGIRSNLISTGELKDILDDDGDGDLADYRQGRSGGDQIADDPLVLDLRGKAYYDDRHIPGAVWIAGAENMAEIENVQRLKSLLDEHVAHGGKNEIVVYCFTGHTAGLVAGVLGDQGLPVRNLMCGFDIAWTGTSPADKPINAPVEDSNGVKSGCGG